MPSTLFRNGKVLWVIIGILGVVLGFAFITNKMLGFFIFFETSLVPTFFLILGWGGQPERVLASFFLISYTALGSLPLLGSVLLINYSSKKKTFFWMNYFFENPPLRKIFFLLFFLGFIIKLPLFGFHKWLTKAHVEAPVVGSMILAGVLLKLGVYGILRFSVVAELQKIPPFFLF